MASTRRRFAVGTSMVALGALLGGGCNAVLGLGDFTDQSSSTSSGSGAAGTGGTSDGGAGQGGGGQGAAAQGGGGGDQGGGGAGGECEPGTQEDCYTGPAGTEDHGICQTGTKVCSPQGTFGPCNGEVLPTDETCTTPDDDDCDGAINEEGMGCVCMPTMTEACYTGPMGTANVGACKPGSGICNDQGTGFVGGCMGETLPATETCASKDGPSYDEDCDGKECVLWAVSFGANGSDVARDVTVDDTGHVYITGLFDGQIAFGADSLVTMGQTDAFLAKLDPQGVAMWGRRWGDGAAQIASAVVYDPSDQSVNAAGTFAGTMQVVQTLTSSGLDDVFVAKFFSDGAPVKSVRFGGPNADNVAGMVKTADKYVLAGEFSGTTEFSGTSYSSFGNFDGYVAAIDTSLGYQFFHTFGSPTFDGVGAIDAFQPNNVNVGGLTNGPMAMGQDTLDHTGPGGAAYVTTFSDGDDFGYAVAGSSVKWGPDGGTGSRRVTAIAAVPLVKYVAGTYNGAIDFGQGPLPLFGAVDGFLAHVDQSNNSVLWSKGYGGPGDQTPSAIIVSPSGNVLLVSTFEQYIEFGSQIQSAGGKDIHVIAFDPTGMLLWQRRFGGPGDDVAHAIAFTNAGGVARFILVGSFEGTVDFGGVSLTAQNQKDVFVLAFAP